ncbi:MAG TPA: 5'/3'-nucleotidase SurE [Candidatus Hypogeohydataceae bacterium YC41]
MKILLTNDDGVYAQGLGAIKKSLQGLGEVVVVAPDAEQSGVGHSITFSHPLRIRPVYVDDEFFGYGVSGSPADCVKLGVMEIMKCQPRLLVSGINMGSNTGIHVLYSGTVAAAIEGAILGIPSVALSLDVSNFPDLEYAAIISRDIIEILLGHDLPRGTLLNVNFPSVRREEIKGVRFTKQYTYSFEESVDCRKDPGGKTYYWLVGGREITVEEEGTDTEALSHGYISITPLTCDLTNHELLDKIGHWEWGQLEQRFKKTTTFLGKEV